MEMSVPKAMAHYTVSFSWYHKKLSSIVWTPIPYVTLHFKMVFTRARISIRTIRTCRMAYLTQFSIPALLNPMINKMADDIAFHMFAWGWGSKWPMIGPRPCSYACAYVDPVFTGQSYDISISTSTTWTNLSISLVLMLMLMSTQFSLAYTHVLGCLCLCLCLCASENQALEIGAARLHLP